MTATATAAALFGVERTLRLETDDATSSAVGVAQRVACGGGGGGGGGAAVLRDRFAPELFDAVGVAVDETVGDFEVVERIVHRVLLVRGSRAIDRSVRDGAPRARARGDAQRSHAVVRGRLAFVVLYLTNNYLLFQVGVCRLARSSSVSRADDGARACTVPHRRRESVARLQVRRLAAGQRAQVRARCFVPSRLFERAPRLLSSIIAMDATEVRRGTGAPRVIARSPVDALHHHGRRLDHAGARPTDAASWLCRRASPRVAPRRGRFQST